MAVGLVYLASSNCQFSDREGLPCSMSACTTTCLVKSPLDSRRGGDRSNLSFRCRIPFSGPMLSQWSPTGQEVSMSKVRVAADFPDSLPDSPKSLGNRGYHPLEELKTREKNKDVVLTDAEIARTIVEANTNALLMFPGGVHNEPHQHVSWAEFQYVIDDYGDIFFQFFDDENILQDRGANNPVAVLLGNDPVNGEGHLFFQNLDVDGESATDISEFSENGDTEVTDTLVKWGMPDTLRYTHPLYFAKCLTKAVHTKYGKKIDHPSNGLFIVGCLRPAFIDEESYLRSLFLREDDDRYLLDWRDESEKEEERVAGNYNSDGEMPSFNSKQHFFGTSSTFYKLEIMTIEFWSVYGDQSMIGLEDFQDAEPDVLARSSSDIIQRVNEYDAQCNTALKAICRRRKGLNVEGAKLIGVDSLGMDVRVYFGRETRTLRFSFNTRAMSEGAAEKKIKRMLFPRYHRKSTRAASDDVREL